MKANLTLNGLYLTGQASEDISVAGSSPIDLTATSTLTLTLAESSTNTLTGGATPDTGIGGPGIHVPEGATLTVQGSGKLDVTGGKLPGSTGNGGVGIGGVAASTSDGSGESCGTVVITGGTVTVTGGTNAFGIGGGQGGPYQEGLMGTVIITGGTVTVPSANAANSSIGGRKQTDSGVAVILVANVGKADASACSASIVPKNERYQVNGALSLPDLVSEYTLPANNTLFFVPLKTGRSTLIIPAGVTLNIPEGVIFSFDSYDSEQDLAERITNNGTVRIACNHEKYAEYEAAFGGKVEPLHDWSNKDGKCKNCNADHTHAASDWADGVCTVCGAAHEHAADDWTYELGAEQNIITATCKVCHKEVTITLEAPTENLTYDGTAKTATVTMNPEGLLTAPEITYSKKGNVNAGEVTASIKLGGVTASVTYTIDKAAINPTVSLTGWTYGEKANEPTVEGNTGGGTVSYQYAVRGDNNYSDTVPTNAGDYTVKAIVAETDNYQSGTATADLTVNKAEKAPNMPREEMKPAKSKETIGDVELPAGWEWSDKSKDTSLETGKAVTGSAIYVGADKGNYEKESVEITLTRSDCDHLYESTVTKEPTTTEEGVRTYTCKNCDDSYTEAIPKKETTGGGSSGGGYSGGGTVLPPIEPDTEIKPDGTKVETTAETGPDGTKVETITETKTDGTKTETITETGKDGSVKTMETLIEPDGAVTSVTEKTVIPESSSTTSTTVTVKKDGEGEIVSAKATVTKTVNAGSKATIQSAVLEQIIEAAGTEDVTITMTVKDAEGKTKYTVKADAGDFEPGNELYIYKYDIRAKEYTLVNAKTYTVSKAGNVSVSMKIKATYYLVDAEEAAAINKKIVSTIKPKKSKATVKKGKSVTFTLSDKVNPDNIKSITYTTSKKSVATVGGKGKVSAKKKGTVIIKAKVTLKNGMTKTIKMTIKVK